MQRQSALWITSSEVERFRQYTFHYRCVCCVNDSEEEGKMFVAGSVSAVVAGFLCHNSK